MEAIFIYLDNLLDSQPQIREFGFQKLVEYGGEALPLLLGALMMRKYEKSTPAIMQIIEKIPPSPSINDIVPVLLRFLVDGNKPNYKLAYNFLLKMDENEIINNANEILTYNWSDDMWIQGVCSLLSNLNSNKLSPLVSPLINLLKIGTKKNCLDEHAIDVLAKIGSPKANEAVPCPRQN